MKYTHSDPAGSPAVHVQGLHKSYGSHTVLDGLDLAVTEPVHALLGPNGAGKTTLINILSTLIPADRGRVQILGLDLPDDRREVQRLISVTGQFAAVDELLNATENLQMMARLLGLGRKAARARSAELLEQFNLTAAATKPVTTYSGGMRRRLDLAISMICTPALLFLDEPTTGLDTRSRQMLWSQIRTLAAGGTTVLLTTQYLEEADVLADRVSVLDEGSIVAQGTPEQLKAAVGGTVLELLDDAGSVNQEIATDGTVEHVCSTLSALRWTHAHQRVNLRRPTMDEAFLHLTGAEATVGAAPGAGPGSPSAPHPDHHQGALR
ncbi:MAG TPA: ATP-binding cassette domain-containing protein [Beutenbergiaceae bacterium]|nr:ATP-binding cassette domain-containing protein [Beutenbergiaceae bacterium]